jgi:hypothetical protein
MGDGADHVIRNVLPPVVRQWVLSLPRRVRFLAARHPALASRLLDVFTRAIIASQKRSARRLGAAEPRTGGVTAIQRFGGALNLNVHFHTIVPDGVFAPGGDSPATFLAIPQPRDEDVAAILERVVRRAAKVLVGFDEEVESAADALAALQAAEVDRRLRFPDEFRRLPRRLLAPRRRPHPRPRSRRAREAVPLRLAPTARAANGSRRARRAGSCTG